MGQPGSSTISWVSASLKRGWEDGRHCWSMLEGGPVDKMWRRAYKLIRDGTSVPRCLSLQSWTKVAGLGDVAAFHQNLV
jgi:hypothetical protein